MDRRLQLLERRSQFSVIILQLIERFLQLFVIINAFAITSAILRLQIGDLPPPPLHTVAEWGGGDGPGYGAWCGQGQWGSVPEHPRNR